jgi:hypothetical protein
MSMGWSDLTPEGKKFFGELEQLSRLNVKAGFQSGTDASDDGTSIMEIAMYNELGTSTPSPSRPFMRQSFENHQDKLQEACDKVVTSVTKGTTARMALNELGVTVVGIIQDEIDEGAFESNAESTIKKKKSTKPLIDTGRMAQSIHYQIAEKE